MMEAYSTGNSLSIKKIDSGKNFLYIAQHETIYLQKHPPSLAAYGIPSADD
jgi:hypothetical protein